MTVINWTADIGATLDTLAADLGLTPLELSAYAGTTTVPVRLTRSVPKMVPNADTAPLVVRPARGHGSTTTRPGPSWR
jgi:hypothetical protein